MGDTEIIVNAGDGYGRYEVGRDFPISKLEKSNSSYQKYVVGVVSKNFSEFSSLGKNVVTLEHHPLPVALNGRVPVKVSTENGPIHAGDYLTTSSIPGVAMKSTKPGFVLGKALSSFNQSSVGEVMVFVNNAWVDPTDYLAFDNNGNLSVNGLTSSTDITVTSITNPDITVLSLNEQISSLSTEVASISAQLSSLNIASVSASLNQVTGLSLDILGNATISGSLHVTAPSVLSDTTIAGTLQVGLIKLNDMTGDLSSLSGLLSFQNGAATLSDSGDLTIIGNLAAKTVMAEKFQILGTATSSASIGKAVIPTGTTELTIDTTAAATSSAIFVTPDQPISTAAFATDSGRFTIKIPASLQNDLNISWWIIN
jgi:hypothetical protein